MTDLTLILFDIDGTVFDSAGLIIAGFTKAFEASGFDAPTADQIKGGIGLSLDPAIARMAPSLSASARQNVIEAYRAQFNSKAFHVPFFEGMEALIHELGAVSHVLVGAATGKSHRGLDPLLERNGLSEIMQIRQTPDNYPSKPSPEMITGAMEKAGTLPARTVMIGDTSFDIDMAHNAGVRSIGVSWGYHDQELLDAKPEVIADKASDIKATLNEWALL